MNKAVHDEFIADYAGIAAANGSFRADGLLLFMGLEDYPRYREDGRLQNYLGDSPPGAGMFAVSQLLVKRAAENLECFETRMRAAADPGAPGRTEMLLALAGLYMEKQASADAGMFIGERLTALGHELLL